MVKIPPSKQPKRQKPARRPPTLPGWLPLAVAIAGLGLLLTPDDASWALRVAGAALLAGGSFWLGQDRQHDPADRSRIVQLEQQLMRIGILDRDLDLRRDVAQALGPRGSRPLAPAAQHGADGGAHRGGAGASQLRAVPDGGQPDLDAPLPGERE